MLLRCFSWLLTEDYFTMIFPNLGCCCNIVVDDVRRGWSWESLREDFLILRRRIVVVELEKRLCFIGFVDYFRLAAYCS